MLVSKYDFRTVFNVSTHATVYIKRDKMYSRQEVEELNQQLGIDGLFKMKVLILSRLGVRSIDCEEISGESLCFFLRFSPHPHIRVYTGVRFLIERIS